MCLDVTSVTALVVSSARWGTMVLDLTVTIQRLGSQEWFRYLPIFPITNTRVGIQG